MNGGHVFPSKYFKHEVYAWGKKKTSQDMKFFKSQTPEQTNTNLFST